MISLSLAFLQILSSIVAPSKLLKKPSSTKKKEKWFLCLSLLFLSIIFPHVACNWWWCGAEAKMFEQLQLFFLMRSGIVRE